MSSYDNRDSGETYISATFDHLTFLDGLHESRVTNIFVAVVHLREAFPELSRKEAISILIFWLQTFAERHPKEEEKS